MSLYIKDRLSKGCEYPISDVSERMLAEALEQDSLCDTVVIEGEHKQHCFKHVGEIRLLIEMEWDKAIIYYGFNGKYWFTFIR